MLGEHALGMKLDPDHGKVSVAERHDGAVLKLGGDFQCFGEAARRDHQRVVAPGAKWARDAVEDAATIVVDDPHPSKNWASTNDVAAKRSANDLMAQANSQNRDLTCQLSHDAQADAGPLRITRAWRKDDRLRPKGPKRRNVNGIVSADERLLSKLFQITGKVVDEAIVVVDEEDHQGAWTGMRSKI